MQTVPVKIPSVGESITEGILAKWIKPNGSFVKSGEPLFELETDKASNVVPALVDGTLQVSVEEGATVPVGSTIGHIDPAGKPGAASPSAKAAANVVTETLDTDNSAEGAKPMSPAARRAASDSSLDPGKIEGTGRHGVVLKEDVLTHTETRATEPVSPAKPSPAPQASSNRRQTRQRISGIRQKIAQRLVEAQQTAAILTTFNEADLSRVIDLRRRHKESFQKKHGVGLGFMGFFVKAAIEALEAYPVVNAQMEGNELVFNHYYDIGVAVSTERGLMVPVLRDADRLRFAAIEQHIAEFAKKARDSTISVDDLIGGTFTITNGGVFGSLLSTPILNPPQSAILGMHAIQKRPVVVDDQIAIRQMMYLALSYDHRIIDGREAVGFLVRIKECIENPERMMFEV